MGMKKTYEKDGLVYSSSTNNLYSGELIKILGDFINSHNSNFKIKSTFLGKKKEKTILSKTITNFRDGIKEGIEETYIRDEIYSRVNYNKGMKESSDIFRDGKLIERCFYENKKIKSEEQYQEGKLIRRKVYYENLRETYYPNGQLEKKENYINNPKYLTTTNLDGVCESFYENGQLQSRENYSKGIPLGLQEYFFENGQCEKRYTIENNRVVTDLEGLEEVFYKNGNLRLQRIHEKGKYQTFSAKTFYENGQIKEKGNYIKGEQVGLWITYYENGNIKSKKTQDESIQRKIRISQSMRDEIGDVIGGSEFMSDSEKDVFGD